MRVPCCLRRLLRASDPDAQTATATAPPPLPPGGPAGGGEPDAHGRGVGGRWDLLVPPIPTGSLVLGGGGAQPGCLPASGTSIGGAFYVTLIGIKVRGVKRRGPVTRFGLKLDV